MKKLIIIILSIVSSNGLFAQEGEKLSKYCQNFNYQEIETGLIDFQSKSTPKIKYKWHTQIERELVNDHFEQIIEFKKEVQDDDNPAIHTIYTHWIKLIKNQQGKVAYYRVVQLKNVKSNGNWVLTNFILKEDSSKILGQLKTDFLKTYAQPLNFKGLFRTDIVFGNHCGMGGYKPEYRVKMNKLVKSKDTSTLIQWLKSTTIEIQLYAIEGILTLKKEGIEFEKQVLDLINLIEKKKGRAYTCSGCIRWNESISEIIKRIKKEHTKG